MIHTPTDRGCEVLLYNAFGWQPAFYASWFGAIELLF